jgi:uncharacterized protein (DUF433 family)
MPTIAGTRIGVHHVVEQVLHGTESVESVAAEVYPHLSEQDVRDAIEWSFDNSAKYNRLLKEYEQEKRRVQDAGVAGPDDLPADL